MSDLQEIMWCQACATLGQECECAGKEIVGWMEVNTDVQEEEL